jgi:hypothetical protein
MDAISQHGWALAHAAFNSNNFRPLAGVLKDAMSTDVNRRNAGGLAATAAIVELSRILQAARDAGYRFTPEPPKPCALAYRAASSPAEFWKDALAVLDTSKALIRRAPGIRAEYETSPPPAAAKPETAAPEPVAPVQSLPAGPLEVRVVSMVARTTRTSVERNMAGEIVRASQIETDL